MSIALETEWLGLAAFFGLPILYLLTGKSWSAKNEAYYQFLSRRSSAFFLQGTAKRVVFPLVWTIFFMATIPTSGFMFWFTVDPAVSGVFNYNLGLGFYWVGLLLLFSWSRIFFDMYMPTLAFFITLGIIAAWAGFLAMCIIVGMVTGIVLTALLLAWLVMALIWTGIAAFAIEAYTAPQRLAGYVNGREGSSNDFDNDPEDKKSPLLSTGLFLQKKDK